MLDWATDAESASVGGRVALGPRAGRRVGRLGDPPGPPAPPALASRSPRQAHLVGFDLRANVRVPPRDRARLGQLCRYVLRPPLAQIRLGLLPDGQVVVTLKATWRDGTRALVFHLVEFLAALAVLTPRPEINLPPVPRSVGPACALAPGGCGLWAGATRSRR